MATPPSSSERRLARLIDVGRGLLSELDIDVVLDRVLETAAELTDARYAALGILDESRRELARFLTRGIDEATHEAIGDLPRGRGILGVLIDDPQPLRLTNVGDHPRSYGFPLGHPPMSSFLGVPVIVRGEAWGNLYLTQKRDGEPFTEEDEQAAVVLADWAAIAIDNARLYREATTRRDELERAVRGLEATAAIARAVGGEVELDRILELIVKRGRALVNARDLLILLRDGDELVVTAGAGQTVGDNHAHLPIDGSTAGEVLLERRPRRVTSATTELKVAPTQIGIADASSALLVPLLYRGTALGVLAAFDHLDAAGDYSRDDEKLMEAFAAQAATAVATARSVESDRVRRSLLAAESERSRWARELHDDTLQALGGLKVLLSSASRLEDATAMRAAMVDATEQLTENIAALRHLIAELRPAALDDLGLGPALSSLAARTGDQSKLTIRPDIQLRDEERLAVDLETAAYRLVQEALSNVVKHAQASTVDVAVHQLDGVLRIRVADDGIGMRNDPQREDAFGLRGMRERVELLGGGLAIERGQGGGTVVEITMPVR